MCALGFASVNPGIVIKAAHRIGFGAYPVISRDLAALASRLPEGRLTSKGAVTVPKVPQTLYSEVVVELVADPKQAIETADQAVGLARRHWPASRPRTRSRLAIW